MIRAHAQPGRPCPLFWPPPNPALAAQRLREAQEVPIHGQGSDAVIGTCSLGQVPLTGGQPSGQLAAQEWAHSEEFWAVTRTVSGSPVPPVTVTAAAEAGTSGGGSAGAHLGASAGHGQGLSPAVEQWGWEGALGQSASASPGLEGMGWQQQQQQQQEGGRQATSHPLLDDPDDNDDDDDDDDLEEEEEEEGEEAGEAGGVGVEGSQRQPNTLLQAMHSAVTGALQSSMAQLNMVRPCASYRGRHKIAFPASELQASDQSLNRVIHVGSYAAEKEASSFGARLPCFLPVPFTAAVT